MYSLDLILINMPIEFAKVKRVHQGVFRCNVR